MLHSHTHLSQAPPRTRSSAAAAALLAGALLLLAAPAAAGKQGIHLLNATMIDSLLSKPVPVPIPHNQTAVEKKAALFREVSEWTHAVARPHNPLFALSLSLSAGLGDASAVTWRWG